MSEFKFSDRGYKGTTVLVPGWGTDYRVFDTLDLETNYLTPVTFSPFSFDKDLLAAMAGYGLDKISVIGWSMGAFAACDFISAHGDHVSDVILIGVRKRYEREKLKEIRAALEKNKKAFLYKFYKDFFSKNEKSEYAWFRDNLSKDYIGRISLDDLIEGLDYLSESEIKTDHLKAMKTSLIHGKEDKVAPIEGALELRDGLPAARFVAIDGSGHMPFLRTGFKDILYKTDISHG